jgi:hypothetical protein
MATTLETGSDMKDEQLTLYKLTDIFDFIEVNGSNEVYHKFFELIEETVQSVPDLKNAVFTRLTNDPATRLGITDNMARKEGILALPLPKGVYFFSFLEVIGVPPLAKIEANRTYTMKTLSFIVIDFDKQTIEDQTRNLVGE